MASNSVLDLERLLSPISAEQPCGDALPGDVFAEIKELRKADDLGPIVALATDALAGRSKDLRLAAYLLEAVMQQEGFPGLRDGLALLNGLLEQYWDTVYPQIEQDEQGNVDLSLRASPLDLFKEKIPIRVQLTALMPGGGDDPLSWNFWNSRNSGGQREGEDPESYARRRLEAEQRAQTFDTRAAEIQRPHFVTLVDDLAQSAEQAGRLREQVIEKFAGEAPSLSRLVDSIEDCRRLADAILRTKPAPIEEQGADGEDGATTGNGAVRKGPIGSRADALAQLANIAAFFRQTEPHSPISYLIQRAARWGTMSLEQVILELVKDEAVRGQIGELLDFAALPTIDESSQ